MSVRDTHAEIAESKARSKAPRKLPGGISQAQQSWKHSFAVRHGLSTPLLDPDPQPVPHSLRGD